MYQYNRKNWYNIPVNERMGLLKEYKKQGYSYRDAIDNFETSLKQYEEGGVIEEPIVQRPVNNLLQGNIQFNQPQTQQNSTYIFGNTNLATNTPIYNELSIEDSIELSIELIKKWKSEEVRENATFNKPSFDSDSFLHNIQKNINNVEKNEDEQVISKYYKKYNSENKEDVKKIQKELYEKGLFEENIKIETLKTKKDVQKIQKFLNSEGYSLPKSKKGNSFDGILGTETKKAIKEYNENKNIDGYFGDKTKAAFEKSNKKEVTITFEDCVTYECAETLSNIFDRNFGNTKQSGVYGHAWNMFKNIKNSNGKILYNIYDKPEFKNIKDKDILLKTTEKNISNDYKDIEIRIGDIIGIYNKHSSHHEDVLKEGNTFNTHVGIVTDFKNGVPIVTSSYYGNLKHEPINKIKVTTIGRPKNIEIPIKALKIISKDSKIMPNKEVGKLKEYSENVNDVVESLMRVSPNENIDKEWLIKAAISISGPETGLTRINVKPEINKFEELVRDFAGYGKYNENKSAGLTKFKLGNLKKSEQKFLDINSIKDLTTPEGAAKATTYYLFKNYNYFIDFSNNNPDLQLSEEDIKNLTMLSYNRGMKGLINFGFDEKGKFSKERLKSLKSMAEGEAEFDKSATKLRVLPDIIGNVVYKLKYPEGQTPYIKKVNDYITTLF